MQNDNFLIIHAFLTQLQKKSNQQPRLYHRSRSIAHTCYSIHSLAAIAMLSTAAHITKAAATTRLLSTSISRAKFTSFSVHHRRPMTTNASTREVVSTEHAPGAVGPYRYDLRHHHTPWCAATTIPIRDRDGNSSTPLTHPVEPHPPTPYCVRSQAIKANGFVYISGQVPLVPGVRSFLSLFLLHDKTTNTTTKNAD